jgi:hypothetical protein
MKKAYFSRRLYKSKMDILPVTETSYALELFNCAKRFAFQTLIREKRWGRKLHQDGRWGTFYMCFHRHIAGRPERDTSDILYGYFSR